MGIPVRAHLLPEAGDGKDRCDRDFAGVNRLFDSYLKQGNKTIQDATEIVAALQYGKKEGDGVINAAIEVVKPMDAVELEKSFSTAEFTKRVGKARDNMYYTEFEYSRSVSGTFTLTGVVCFAYYKFGKGVRLSSEDLEAIWPARPQLPVSTIIAGTTLGASGPHTNLSLRGARQTKSWMKRR